MIGRHFTTALITLTLILTGSGISAMDASPRYQHRETAAFALSPDVTHFIQFVSWDISISVGKRGSHRHYRRGHGHYRHYRHGHRHYGYYRGPHYGYRDQGHPDYGYRSYGYRSNRYDSDGNYQYRGGRYRYWHPYGRGHGYGDGYRHRR